VLFRGEGCRKYPRRGTLVRDKGVQLRIEVFHFVSSIFLDGFPISLGGG